ncbi:NADPH-dependent FMN reductase [Nitrosomonas oligotropha]|uniref:NADPH-dependent FMN reductase n=1 Tax=Nitrosomonas oligotropha TaxID=42354 RepID=UPI00136A6310|nr:NAD(P)H-dependent oxidoreductase [Nitrosomonas oligotropha]MXS82785.1 NADPH-dependent oxidoreductase [Nitrosomonas oligotropha]
MKLLIFLGTVRGSSPPSPPRLGLRVANACVMQLHQGDISVDLIDPLDFDLGLIFKPHFAYAQGKAPAQLQSLAEKIAAADGYVMVSPEYNHSLSPALTHLLNHFGSSLFSYKPSAIVTYSAGQWGGVRAAVGMRSFLSELGCLPVSAMIHIPKAHEVLAEDGSFLASVDAERWTNYFARSFAQLTWWASAAKNQRDVIDPLKLAPAFKKDPSQRNAP